MGGWSRSGHNSGLLCQIDRGWLAVLGLNSTKSECIIDEIHLILPWLQEVSNSNSLCLFPCPGISHKEGISVFHHVMMYSSKSNHASMNVIPQHHWLCSFADKLQLYTSWLPSSSRNYLIRDKRNWLLPYKTGSVNLSLLTKYTSSLNIYIYTYIKKQLSHLQDFPGHQEQNTEALQ